MRGVLELLSTMPHVPSQIWNTSPNGEPPNGLTEQKANNPKLSRYVAPNDGLLGEPSLRHWNRSGTR